MSDSRLEQLRESLTSDLTDDVFEELTHFAPPDEDTPPRDGTFRETALEYVEACIQYREEIRPDSLRSLAELPDEVDRTTTDGWVYYFSNHGVEHSRPIDDANETKDGKYLFFTPTEAQNLEDIVLDEFPRRPYSSAKLPTKLGKKEDWVLCLYQEDNRYWYDVREAHHNPPDVRFRGYKTNEETRQGEYSDRFDQSRSDE
ncbi:hypothetical protein [Halobaculum rubrum]|uniref:hypothetical protein n=1 Tax=Halobaculum rubrum TaxID=2872158 RepID=UPI001CA3D02B|nr:hypothetical protein [Halobaculum rubrum]QZY01188.1 hypothetical protein K6T25_15100 [Halobaculum rubrum]